MVSGCGTVGRVAPEIHGSNPSYFTVNCIGKTKIKKKLPEIAHFKAVSDVRQGVLLQSV